MLISTFDIIIVCLYLAGIVAIGLLATRKQKLTTENYFLAGRGLGWGTVGAALFASNISTIHLTGLAADGYRLGFVAGNWEWMATFTLVLLSLIFTPFYIKTKLSTLPEFLERRFDARSRTIMAVMAIFSALFIHIGISLYAGAVVFQKFFGVDVIVSVVGIAVLTSIYTVAGGLKAVVITENIQTVILLLGSTILTVLAISAVKSMGIDSWASLEEVLRPGQLKMLHSYDSDIGQEGYTWYAFFLGYPVLGIWYWCTDQTIVQRVLGAKSSVDAQKGALFAGLLKILPLFIIILPGVLAYALFQEQISHPNETLPVLIQNLLPSGLKGLFAAALLAALMSTVSAALNSCSSLVSLDIIKRVNKDVTESAQIYYGRITAVVVMILAILWSTQAARFDSIFQAINDIGTAIAPPISAVFLLGVFYRRGTKDAAYYTLLIGFILGIALFLLDFEPVSGQKFISHGLGIPFLMRGWWLFCISVVLFVIISQFTSPPEQAQVEATTWNTPLSFLAGSFRGVSDVRFMAGALLALMVVLYMILG